MGEWNPFEDEPDIFSDLVAYDGFATVHQEDSLADAAAASPADCPTNTLLTPSSVDSKGNQSPAVTEAPKSAIDGSKTAPDPDSVIKPDDGEKQPSRVKKRRRSRNSPEPDYSEMIVELNKKRKRTGQACDRCRVRRYRCDPGRSGCFNCCLTGVECKVTDCVTGETYVRGAVGRMAAEIESLKAHAMALKQENDELRREAELKYDPKDGNLPFPAATSNSPMAFAGLRQHVQMQQQHIVCLQQEISHYRRQYEMIWESRKALQKRIEEQDELLRITQDATLFNNKQENWNP